MKSLDFRFAWERTGRSSGRNERSESSRFERGIYRVFD